MASQLQSINLVAPAFKGLNLEDSPLAQEPSYAEVADNAIIDQSGRIAARKGYVVTTTDKTALGSGKIRAIEKYRDDARNSKFFSVGNNKIFSGTTTLVDETPAGYTISDDDWKLVNFNESLYFFQKGHEPLVYNDTLGAVTPMSSVPSASNVTAAMYGNEVLAAFGRLWTADVSGDKNTIYWSDLLNGVAWTGGSSGSIDISDVWPQGYDRIVALGAHNNFLIILGEHSIVVYQGATDPATMVLQDTVSGVGCVNRDTVQYTGTDMLFVSQTGLKSFARTIQEKSMPLTDRSRNVKRQITSLLNTEIESYRSVYSPEEQFYLINFVGQKTIYCFDLRGELENRAFRVTRWPSTNFSCFFRDEDDGKLYIGTSDGICTYEGYLDNQSTYRFRYESPGLSFGDSSRVKMLKKIKPTVVGANSESVTLTWAYDFEAFSKKASFQVGSQSVSFFNEAEYTVGQYSSGTITTRKAINANGSGEVIIIGFEVDVNDNPVSLQEINVLALIGRLL